jgi:hypothetical protein
MEWDTNFIYVHNLNNDIDETWLDSFLDPRGTMIEKRNNITIIKSFSNPEDYGPFCDHVDFNRLIRKRENGLFLPVNNYFLLGSNVDFDIISPSQPEFVIHYKAEIFTSFPLFLEFDDVFKIKCKEETKIILKLRYINFDSDQYSNLTFLIKDSNFIIKNRKLEKRDEISDRNGFVDDNFQDIVVPPSFII